LISVIVWNSKGIERTGCPPRIERCRKPGAARVITGSRWRGPRSSASSKGAGMSSMIGQQRRCAIYMHESSDEGLARDFKSLHAPREAFIHRQQGPRPGG